MLKTQTVFQLWEYPDNSEPILLRQSTSIKALIQFAKEKAHDPGADDEDQLLEWIDGQVPIPPHIPMWSARDSDAQEQDNTVLASWYCDTSDPYEIWGYFIQEGTIHVE